MSSESSDNRILQPSKLKVVRNLFDVKPPAVGNYDRFIPCRANNNWEASFAVMPDPNKTPQSGKKSNRENGENSRDSSVYNILLRNEILGEKIEDVKTQCDDRQALTPIKSRNLFRYGTPIKVSVVLLLLDISVYL